MFCLSKHKTNDIAGGGIIKVGIPKGLLYFKYYPFIEKFLKELDAEIIVSKDTNKEILNLGVKYCVDEACHPIKIFHGHVASIKDRCDLMIIPRIMRVKKGEYICPKFCGLPEMIIHSIPDMPDITLEPLYLNSEKKFNKWIMNLGLTITKDKKKIKDAFTKALLEQKDFKLGINDENYDLKVAVVGHPYSVYDKFINMDIMKKLNKLGVGAITEDCVNEDCFDIEAKKLYKKPFWSFTKNSYGFCSYLVRNKEIDGIIYISSFGCGIDSVSIELIKNEIKDFPFLVLKIDEQTGEAGVDTRIQAFIDMLERRYNIENNISPLW